MTTNLSDFFLAFVFYTSGGGEAQPGLPRAQTRNELLVGLGQLWGFSLALDGIRGKSWKAASDPLIRPSLNVVGVALDGGTGPG